MADAMTPSPMPDGVPGQADRWIPRPGPGLPSPDAAALDNARRGTWVVNDYLDGWMLLGANGRPVMRADGSRVAFWFRDADRLARELVATEAGAPPTTKRRIGLAALDSGFDRDWDPDKRRAYFADVTKAARLLAYHYVQTTEPEEAVRRAIATVLGDPVTVQEGNTDAFVPRRYNLAAVRATADAMRSELVGREIDAAETTEPSDPLDATANEEGGAPDSEQQSRDDFALRNELVGLEPATAEAPEPNVLLDAPVGTEGGAPDAGQQSRNGFDDVADAWLEKALSGVVSTLNGEDSEDVRVQLHELADKLKPFAEFVRAIAEQHTTITSGKIDVGKLLGPLRAVFDLARDPDGAAILMALGTGGKTSKIDPKRWRRERGVLWKKEAQDVNQNFSAEDLERMKRGRAQRGSDGYPMEWHHIDGTHEGGVKKMTRTDHRLGDNYRKNHPKKKSEDDHD